MISFYPNKNLLKYKLHSLCGSGVGIGDSKINTLAIANGFPNMQIFQGDMPSYEKLVINTDAKMVYHISGYGMSVEESLVRLLGETIERYSFLYGQFRLSNLVTVKSYDALISEGKNAISVDYLNVLKETSISKIRRAGIDLLYTYYHSDKEIRWTKFLSLMSPQKTIYVPEVMAYISQGTYSTMSTGTATHVSQEEALSSAIIEILQIHTFMLFWYLVIPSLQIELDSISIKNVIKKLKNDSSIFDIIVLDITNPSVGLPTFVTICQNKKDDFPFMSFGIQSGFDIEQTIIRSMMEACAIYNSFPYISVVNHEYINSISMETLKKSINLDDNFYYWANANELNLKKDCAYALIRNEKVSLTELIDKYEKKFREGTLRELFKIVSKISTFACTQDISDESASKYGYYTIRAIIPECLPMCFGLYPFDNHPAFKNNGGIKNGYFPHPLP